MATHYTIYHCAKVYSYTYYGSRDIQRILGKYTSVIYLSNSAILPSKFEEL